MIVIVSSERCSLRLTVGGSAANNENVCRRMGIGRLSSESKGIWWMPWYREAMKDVAPCDKLRGGGSTL